jgi:hypothetical protein
VKLEHKRLTFGDIKGEVRRKGPATKGDGSTATK